jgi:hypothetical protein
MSKIQFYGLKVKDSKQDLLYDIRKEYDHVFEAENYVQIYDHILAKYNRENNYVNISHDTDMSLGTLSAINEQYMIKTSLIEYQSKLKILYISPDIDLLLRLMGDSDFPNKLLLHEDQIICLFTDPDVMQNIQDINIMHFPPDKLNNKEKLEKILDHIIEQFKDHDIYVVFDFRIFKEKISFQNVKSILDKLKNKIKYLDITGFIKTKEQQNNRLIVELVRQIAIYLFDITEKKINVFTENSKFLIYRPVEQENPEDIGWYILRFLDNKTKEEILSKIGDDIKNISIDLDGVETDVYVTTTTIEEQNIKSYFTATNILDLCLFTQEKMFMGFELIN